MGGIEMKQLTCEMCGGTDLMKQDGVFVCQTCGTKYSVEEAKKMMVEGTVEVQGTVKIDDSAKYKNIFQLAEDAFGDERWDSAYSYCNEAMTIRPDDPLVIAMQGLSILGKEKIKTDVPASATNSMKRLVDIIDKNESSTTDINDTLTKVLKYLNKVCKTKKIEADKEIEELNHQKVDYSAGAEKAAAANVALQALGGNVFSQRQAKEQLDEHVGKRQHNEALDAQIRTVENRKKSIEMFESTYEQEIAKAKQKITNKAYWLEHANEKTELDLEMRDLSDRLSVLQAQIDAISKEVSPQIEALQKKKEEKIPEEISVDKQNDLIRDLEKERENLGIFKRKERKAINERLDTVERPRLAELRTRYESARREYLAKINSEIAAIDANGKTLRAEVDKLKKRENEIRQELTKDR